MTGGEAYVRLAALQEAVEERLAYAEGRVGGYESSEGYKVALDWMLELLAEHRLPELVGSPTKLESRFCERCRLPYLPIKDVDGCPWHAEESAA